MKVLIKNEYSSLEIGGRCNQYARITDIKGLGLPEKESDIVVFSGQSGQTLQSIRDLPRTITIAFDFYGGQREIEQIYKLVYSDVDIYITSGITRRKIKGRCQNPDEVQRIIYHKWYSLVLQFICDIPYFTDFYDTKTVINQRTDLFPNVYEDGKWYIELPAIATERISRAKIINSGQIDVYPVIYIYNSTLSDTEPEEIGIIITNETTGAYIFLEYNPLGGEEIVIDLPHRKIKGSISGDITNYISDDTVLSNFKFKPGENIISAVNLNTQEEISIVTVHNNNYAMAVI